MVKGYQPTSLKEALEIRSSEKVTLYGGGTDLMVEEEREGSYLFLNKIPEMREIKEEEGFLRIGAACTFTEVLEHPDTPKIMKEAISSIASPAIRNLGTMGGNIGNGSSKGDSVLVLFVADAKLRIVSLRGERIIDIDKFYLGRKKLDLREDEIIVEILLPMENLDNYSFEKVAERQALAISRVAFAGVFAMEGDRISKVAVAFGAVASTFLRFKAIEEKLIGKTLEEARALKEEYISLYDKATVFTEGRVSAEFRKEVCMNLLRDFLSQNGI